MVGLFFHWLVLHRDKDFPDASSRLTAIASGAILVGKMPQAPSGPRMVSIRLPSTAHTQRTHLVTAPQTPHLPIPSSSAPCEPTHKPATPTLFNAPRHRAFPINIGCPLQMTRLMSDTCICDINTIGIVTSDSISATCQRISKAHNIELAHALQPTVRHAQSSSPVDIQNAS